MKENKKRWYHFLAPRYWPIWFFAGFLFLLAQLPYSLLLRIGSFFGWALMLALPKRKKVTDINLALCFPELSEEARNNLCKNSFRSNGIGLCELALAWFASDKRLKKMVTATGLENLATAKSQDHGVLTVTCHFTSIELGLRLLSFYTPLNIMYRPQDNLCFEWILSHRRRHYIRECISRRNMHGMMRALKQKDAIMCYTPDQDMGKDGTIFAPFFGVQANTVIGTNYFAKRTGAAVLPGFYYRLEKDKKYLLNFLPILSDFPSDNAIEDATRINQLIENAILKHPEQYMWQHRRFKTRPPGEENFY